MKCNLCLHFYFFVIILGLVTIPLQNTKLATTKAGEPVLTKTIQLTSAQMVKLV